MPVFVADAVRPLVSLSPEIPFARGRCRGCGAGGCAGVGMPDGVGVSRRPGRGRPITAARPSPPWPSFIDEGYELRVGGGGFARGSGSWVGMNGDAGGGSRWQQGSRAETVTGREAEV